ncbi:MAG: hypothetical protein ACOC9Q_01980 [bacterium]
MRILSPVVALMLVTALAACGDDNAAGEVSGNDAASADDGSSAQAPGVDAAEDADGTITATLNGERSTWYVLSQESGGEVRSQSDWSDFGVSTSVSLFGHVSPTSTRSTGALSVGFVITGTGDNPSVGEPDIAYLAGGLSNMYVSNDDASVTVTSADVDGDIMTISGSFSGTLTYHSRAGAEPEDGVTEIAVDDGTFEAKVHELKH